MRTRRSFAAPILLAVAAGSGGCAGEPAEQDHPNLCGAWDIEGPPLSCYPDSPSVARVSHNVFLMERRGRYRPCTGWLVASADTDGLLAFTANHCVPEEANLADITRFKFLHRASDACNALDAEGHFAQYPAETTIEGALTIESCDADVRYVAGVDVDGTRKLDYTVLRFQGATALAIRDHLTAASRDLAIGLPAAGSCTTLADATHGGGDRIFVLGHPSGRAQNIVYLDSGEHGSWDEPDVYDLPLTAADVRVDANRGRIRSFPTAGGGTQVQYDLDTEPGNSGSPVWSDDHDAVVALHISGLGCGRNAGTRMDAILDHVPTNGVNTSASPRRSVREILTATTW